MIQEVTSTTALSTRVLTPVPKDIVLQAKKILLRHSFPPLTVKLGEPIGGKPTILVRGIMSGRYFADALSDIAKTLNADVKLYWDV